MNMRFLLKHLLLSTAVMMSGKTFAAAAPVAESCDFATHESFHDTVMGYFHQQDANVKKIAELFLSRDMGEDIISLGLTKESSYIDALKVLKDKIQELVIQRDALMMSTIPAPADVAKIHDKIEQSEGELRALEGKNATLKMLKAEQSKPAVASVTESFYDTVMGQVKEHESHITSIVRTMLARDMGLIIESLGETYIDAFKVLRDNIRELVKQKNELTKFGGSLFDGAKEFAETQIKLRSNEWKIAKLEEENTQLNPKKNQSPRIKPATPQAAVVGTSAKPRAVGRQPSKQPMAEVASAAPAAVTEPPRSVGAAAAGMPSSADNKGRYTGMYLGLQERWKVAAAAEDFLQEFFFNGRAEGSELTSTAVLELMYGFLINHPEIYIPDLESFGLFTIASYNTTTHAVTIPQVEQLKNKLLHQALAAFTKGQKLYTTIVQVGGSGSGHYTLVVIERDGKVHMINTMGAFAGDSKYDPYTYIQPELVKALNTHKGSAPIVFTAASNVRTGIQDADARSNSCGIYSFVYWAALMMTQDINAYKRVTAAASEGYLSEYKSILNAVTHESSIDAIVQVDDPSKANDFGVKYLKNPSAEVQAKFERDVRAHLQVKLTALASQF